MGDGNYCVLCEPHRFCHSKYQWPRATYNNMKKYCKLFVRRFFFSLATSFEHINNSHVIRFLKYKIYCRVL